MWVVEVESEVAAWLDNLAPPEFDQAAEAIDRLLQAGNLLRMPLSRPLGDGLFELRFRCEGVARSPALVWRSNVVAACTLQGCDRWLNV